jgi:lysozyme
MKTSPAGIALIKSFEACRLTAYPDPGTGGEPWTIGWGTTGHGIHPGLQISQEQADIWFANDLSKFEECVDAAIDDTIASNEFSACVSLAYNIGCSAFAKSSVCREINAGNMDKAADAFRLWNKGGGVVLPGLVRRREAERRMFLGE